MRQVNTMEDLVSERIRLKLKKNFLENEIQGNITDIKNTLKPLNIITNGIKSATSTKNNSDFIANSAGTIVEMIVRNVIFRNSGLISKWLIPKLVKNVTSNAVHNNKSFLLGKLADVVLSISKKKSVKQFDESTIYS